MTITDTSAAATETGAAVLAGMEIAEPQRLDADGRFFAQLVPAGATVKVHDLHAMHETFADHPHRKTGTVHVHDATSFIDYLTKHGLLASEVWADEARRGLVGVINSHATSDTGLDEGLAGHGDHRVVLELLHSQEWKTWTARDKEWLDQAAFAEHLEDNAIHVVEPDGATMLEIAEFLQATRSSEAKSGIRLDNGTIQLRYEETENATAGRYGDLEIPTTFTLLLAPFVGGERIPVKARFRYRIRGGQTVLSYALLHTDDIVHNAYAEIVDVVRGGVAQPVFLGRPA